METNVLSHSQSKTYKITPKFYKELPSAPGVYMYLNKNKILYVGKAKDLKSRISSYFVPQLLLPKTQQMLNKATHIKIIETLSETEAFLLEATLIKLFKPPYNIQLKDDKTYPYLAISKIYLNSKLKKEYYYKVFITRTLNKRDTIYFGPYPDVSQLRKVLKALRRIFPFPSCSKTKFLEHRKKGRPCLYGQIGLCPAPCVSKENATSKQMILNIRRIKQFLALGQTAYIKKLENKMKQYAKQEQFEKAKYIRDIINKINSLNYVSIAPSSYMLSPNIQQDIQSQIMQEIQHFTGISFKSLKEGAQHRSVINKSNISAQPQNLQKEQGKYFRIEGYDISTLFGSNSTSSMVVSINGEIKKSEFKHLKIRFVEGTSDFDMMRETLLRRLQHPEWGIMDLLLIDGGKPQISSILKALLVISKLGKKTKGEEMTYKQTISNDFLMQLRIINLIDLWEEYLNNKQLLTIDLEKPQGFANYILRNVPIWGIFKPFDYFIAFIPHLKNILRENMSIYLQYLGSNSQFSIETQGNWLIVRPRKRSFGIQHLRNLRDHAHNFAKSYHKKRRDSMSINPNHR